MRLKHNLNKSPNIVIPSDCCEAQASSVVVSSGRKITIKLLSLIFSVSMFSPVLAVELISGTDVADQPFSQNVTGKAFDRYTGEFFVGTAVATVPAGNTISKAGRADSVFTGLANAGDEANCLSSEGKFAIASADGTSAKYVGFSVATGAAPSDFRLIPTAGATDAVAIALGAGADEINVIGPAVSANVGKFTGGYFEQPAGWGEARTATGAYFFARARFTAAAIDASDMTAGAGIKAFLVNDTAPLTVTGIGTTANECAVIYDSVIGAVAGDGAPMRNASANALAIDANSVTTDLHWDPILKTLFVSSTLLAPVAAADFLMAISKVKFRDEANSRLNISDVLPQAINGLAGDLTSIFTVGTPIAANAANSPGIHKIRTMHTSTSKVYLIVNGGVDTTTNGNTFFALRYDPEQYIVVPQAPVVSLDTAKKGMVVANDVAGTALGAGFTRTVAGNALDGGNAGSLVIGGGAAPWPVTAVASDMEVVGDTVYVSYAAADRDLNNDPGVWASTAMFDKDGVVIGWTTWERVMASQVVSTEDFRDRTFGFAIDASNNKIWAVTQPVAGNPTRVVRHDWNTSEFADDSLPKVVNAAFGAGTYSDITCVLDLPKNTPGIFNAANTDNFIKAMTMFGGYERVAFAVTEKGDSTNVWIEPTEAAGFGVPETFKDTALEGAGTVRCLGYSRTQAAGGSTDGYFFAGTDKGLWIWAVTDAAKGNQVGFDSNVGLDTLIADPFISATNSWQQMMDTTVNKIISGPVTSIDSDGTYIYLIEQDVTSVQGTIISKLWRISIEIDVAAMETSVNTVIIAQSGKDEIPANAIFTDFKFITDIDGARNARLGANTDHKCILSTNVGAFYPTQALAGFTTVAVAGATPNAPQGWESKEADKFIGSLFAPKRVPVAPAANDGITHRVIANTLIDDSRGFGYFQNTALTSFNSSSNLTDVGSARYTNLSMAAGTDTLTYLNNRALSFWSDGGRRFYTRRNVSESWGNADFNMLNSFPYNAKEWNMSEPFGDDATNGQTIYWVESISGLGIILAGTPNGVIALQ